MSHTGSGALADASARRSALDPARSFIVQAPAGSGKTELLTQRYLRLLAGVEHPEQILAITFTRKAAAEMRSRILSAIDSAAGEAPASPHKRTTWELARAVHAADERHGWHLRTHPSRLRIQTIDALNATLARRLPVLAGTGSALEPSDDPTPLYEAAAARLIERLGDGSAAAASLEAVVVHLGNRVDRLAVLLCELLAKRDQWLHPIVSAASHAGLRAALERTLRHVIERHLGRVCESLGDERCAELWALTCHAAEGRLREGFVSAAERAVLEACTRRGDVPEADAGSLEAWQAVAEVFFREEGQLYRAVNVRHGFPPSSNGMKARMLRALGELADEPASCAELLGVRFLPPPCYAPEQWRILEALLDVLPLAVAELQMVFQAHGSADYVESALRALQALGPAEEPTDLALAFDYRLQHLLIDEFQDTSYAQLDLLERLTAGWSPGEGRTLFCVGDPMQSIYRFRQAEVGLFLDLKQHGLASVALEPLTLSANFRSTQAIVEWVNRVFPKVLAPADDPEQGAVRYSPSVAALPSVAGGVRVHASLAEDELQEARCVTEIVRDAQRSDPEGTVAVLVTARAHVGAIARELSGAGIEFEAIEIEALRERPVVQDLIALTRALVHLADRTAWLAVLRAPWCGLDLHDLHSLAGARDNLTVRQLLEHAVGGSLPLRLEAGSRVARVYGVLEAALAERGRRPLREWVERTWNALGGPATLARAQDLEDAQAYFRRLDQVETAGDLEDVARLEDQLLRLFASPRAEGVARVEVMTIHRAKGLEFDTVILPSLHRWMRGADRELLRWTRIAGPDGGIVFAPIRPEGQEPDPMYRWIELLERERFARERGRLLYVAATRARRCLHLLGATRLSEEEGAARLIEPRSDSMLSLLWHELMPAFEQLIDHSAKTSPSAVFVPRPVSELRRLPHDWQIPEPDARLVATGARVLDAAEAQPEFDWVTQASRHVGTLVHRELERMVRSGCTLAPPAKRDARRSHEAQLSLFETAQAPAQSREASSVLPRFIAELAELGVPPDRCEGAASRAWSAIERTLGDPRGRWLLGATGEIREAESELALSGLLDARIVSGVIDRTFIDRDGVRWIVDFKTSVHEGGGLDAFLEAEAQRYRPQLERYARLMRALRPGETVRAALYFPLLARWKEL